MSYNKSVQNLLGLETFGKYGLILNNRTELVYFAVAPSNIAVMSSAAVERKINNLMMLLSCLPDIEIICTDGCECFDNNKIFLKMRIETETQEEVRELLKKDFDFMNTIQSELSNSRQFFFCYKFRNQSDDAISQLINRIEKTLNEYDFSCLRLDKNNIKKLLALYFGVSSYGDEIPDVEYVKTEGEITND